jgi:hypothetical protein
MKSVKILKTFRKLKICESVAMPFLFFSGKSVSKHTNKLIINMLQFFSSATNCQKPPFTAKYCHFSAETATFRHFPTKLVLDLLQYVKILAGGYMKNRQKPTLFFANS